MPAAKTIKICGKTYESLSAAARAHGIQSNLLWQRINRGIPEDEWLQPVANPRKGKTVECVEAGEVYVSITAAARAYDCSSTAISLALNCCNRTAMGLHWRAA